MAALTLGPSATGAQTVIGDLNNFDTLNDTGQTCHGFEIEIDDIHSTDITYTFDWNHYGTRRSARTTPFRRTPRGIRCGKQCATSFLVGTSVTLTAKPAKKHVFLGSIMTGGPEGSPGASGPWVAPEPRYPLHFSASGTECVV